MSEPIRFLKYHRGERDSRDVPDFTSNEGYAFVCPKCGLEYVHVRTCRSVPGPYDDRPAAEIELYCENGCETTVIFGNYKGLGYCHYVD